MYHYTSKVSRTLLKKPGEKSFKSLFVQPRSLAQPTLYSSSRFSHLTFYSRFDYNRLGGGRGRGRGGHAHGGRHGGASKVLVKNIPAGLNTIAHINNHFARFGTLVNVQVSLFVF